MIDWLITLLESIAFDVRSMNHDLKYSIGGITDDIVIIIYSDMNDTLIINLSDFFSKSSI